MVLWPSWSVTQTVSMRLLKVSGSCEDEHCPAVYVSDRKTAVVQGDQVTSAEGMTLGEGETAVELPPEIVLDAVTELLRVSDNPEWAQRLRRALECT